MQPHHPPRSTGTKGTTGIFPHQKERVGKKVIHNTNNNINITACYGTYRHRLPLECFHQDAVRDDDGVEDPYLKD